MKKGIVFDIKKFAVDGGPSIRTPCFSKAVLFVVNGAIK
jgi:hypothetical protein